jgi:hypothetical protein
MSETAQTSSPSPDLAEATCAAMEAAALPVVAHTLASGGATDVAIVLDPGRHAIVRCARRPSANDQAAVGKMVLEGDFVWGAVVHEDEAGFRPAGPIEIFRANELDRLTARLGEVREGRP